jgi:hypothetical protein
LFITNVLVRDWQAWLRLKISDIVAPMSFHNRVSLDFPVSLGGYRHPRDPGEPMVLHLVHVPGAPNSGLDARAQFRAGRRKLLEMTFADFEAKIRDELDRMLGAGGFSSTRDILAITVNRWSHGYGYVANSLFDDDDYDAVVQRARQRFSRVAIASSDAGARLRVSIAAMRARALRGGWRRQLGNDGKARVLITPEAARAAAEQPISTRAKPTDGDLVSALRAHVETLKADVARLESERVSAQARADKAIADLADERERGVRRDAEYGDQIAQRDEQLAAARLAADKATAELMALAQRLAAIAEAKAMPQPRRGRLGRAWRWFLRN